MTTTQRGLDFASRRMSVDPPTLLVRWRCRNIAGPSASTPSA
jgi:hypothetical protein